MKKKFFIAVDVGGTKISGALITASGKILVRKKISTPQTNSSLQIFRTLSLLIEQCRDLAFIKKQKIQGIGIGIPGVVNKQTGAILKTPNISLSGFPLRTKLQRKFHVKVAVENDVNLGTLGEHWLGAGRGTSNLIGLFPGTGIGGGIIINHQLFSGANGAAGELGHITLDYQGPKCSCGHLGCLEALASRWAIERDIGQAIKNGKKSLITKLTKNKLRPIKSGTLKEALKQKDPLVQRIIQEKATILGVACINLRRIFDPEMIVLGGGVIEACGPFMLPIIKKIVNNDRFFNKLKPCPIVPSLLGDDAVLLGAIALAKKS